MPSPIRFTCSVLGSTWERGVWAQSPGPAARQFCEALRGAPVWLPAWRVIRLTWVVPSGKYKGNPREAHYLWHGDGSVNPYHPRPATHPKGPDEAYQDKPLPEPPIPLR